MRLAVPTDEVTRAVTTDSQLREVTRRTNLSDTQSPTNLTGRAKHVYMGSGTIPSTGASVVTITSYPTCTINDGLVSHDGAGTFRLLAPGDWELSVSSYSYSTSSGNQWTRIDWASPNPLNGMEILDARYRGYAELLVNLRWRGFVPRSSVGVPITTGISWNPSVGAGDSVTNISFSLEYLGSPIEVEPS